MSNQANTYKICNIFNIKFKIIYTRVLYYRIRSDCKFICYEIYTTFFILRNIAGFFAFFFFNTVNIKFFISQEALFNGIK